MDQKPLEEREKADADQGSFCLHGSPYQKPKHKLNPPKSSTSHRPLLSLESSQQPRVAHPRPHRASPTPHPGSFRSLSRPPTFFFYLRTACTTLCVPVRRGCPPRRGGRWARSAILLAVSHSPCQRRTIKPRPVGSLRSSRKDRSRLEKPLESVGSRVSTQGPAWISTWEEQTDLFFLSTCLPPLKPPFQSLIAARNGYRKTILTLEPSLGSSVPLRLRASGLSLPSVSRSDPPAHQPLQWVGGRLRSRRSKMIATAPCRFSCR